MPSQEDMRPEGRSHFLSDRNVAHSAKDGTAVPLFFPDGEVETSAGGVMFHGI
jgi:hypothetical protein